MLSISDSTLEEVAALIGAGSLDDEALERRVAELVQDSMLAKRVIAWLPEAFALVFIPNVWKLTLPKTFSVKNKAGDWIQLDLDAEPIFESAVQLATRMVHEGPKSTFKALVLRSALLSAANRALNEGGSLEGAVLCGPALLGIPAEVYLPSSPSIWHKLFGRAKG